jgi:hypothetical protein
MGLRRFPGLALDRCLSLDVVFITPVSFPRSAPMNGWTRECSTPRERRSLEDAPPPCNRAMQVLPLTPTPRSFMTVTRTENPRSHPSPGEPSRTALSPVQVAASALAAVSAAVVASFFGVAGTLIGAAVASVISTVSATLYSSSLQRTRRRLLQARTQFAGPLRTPHPAPPSSDRLIPPELDPRRTLGRVRPRRWSRVALSAATVFLVAMGIVTGIELIGQRPVSALVGASHSSGTTTIGALSTGTPRAGTAPSPPSEASRSPATSIPASPPSAQQSATDNRAPESAAPSTTEEAPTSASTSSAPTSPSTSPASAASGTPTP